MDLSKAFDILNRELVNAKLKCYQLDQHAVEFFRSYLSNRYQCCKINNTLGDWRKIIDLQWYYTKTQLCFDEHIINICKTANKKLNALSRINHCMKQNQKEILLPSFIISHFKY